MSISDLTRRCAGYLLLAGMLVSVGAQEKSPERPTAESGGAYAGIEVGPRRSPHAVLPDGVGVVVRFIDPRGPGAGRLEEGDVLTRFEDQVLRQADQFQALVRLRQPGDKVGLTLVRGAEPMVVDIALVKRPANPPFVPAESPPRSVASPASRTTTGRTFSFGFGQSMQGSKTTVITDAEGSVTLRERGGKKHAVVTDAQGKVLFDGDVTTPASVEPLPAEIRRLLKKAESRGFGLPKLPPAGPGIKPAEPPKPDPKKGA